MKMSAFIVSLMACASAAAWADEIRIAASDLLAECIQAPLEAYADENDKQLRVESIGSLPALDRLRSDEIDLALIAVPAGEDVPREEFNIYPFAYDVAVIVVNGSNPLDEISLKQLGGIFGSDEEYNFNTWGDLGLTGWGSRNIKLLAGATQESIAIELFRYSVFTGGSMKPAVAMVSASEVEELLATDAASIGILSKLPENRNIKVLMIASGEDAPAFGPTEDNIHYGDYPIRLSFYIAFNPRDKDKLKEIIRVLLEEEIAGSLAAQGFFSLPDTVRRQFLIDLDLQR